MILGTIIFILLVVGGRSAILEPGSCSRSCKETSASSSSEKEKKVITKYPCSCSPSCALYGDCCYDSPYRKEDYQNTGVSTVCLPFVKRRRFLAVDSCPSTFSGSTKECKRGTYHLSPVTSRKTGITYTNIHCAICNDDNEEIISWNTTLKCCPLAEKSEDDSQFVSVRDSLWKVLVNEDGTLTYCQCKYRFDRNDTLNGLEVRPCERHEISTCSMTWNDGNVYSTCKSYVDPLFVQGTIYRNLHCAMCNYATASEGTCLSLLVNGTHSQGFDHQLLALCHTYTSRKCFLLRGRLYSFSELLRIKDRECLPPPESRCCVGQQYDFKHKRCRKIAR